MASSMYDVYVLCVVALVRCTYVIRTTMVQLWTNPHFANGIGEEMRCAMMIIIILAFPFPNQNSFFLYPCLLFTYRKEICHDWWVALVDYNLYVNANPQIHVQCTIQMTKKYQTLLESSNLCDKRCILLYMK